MKRLSLFALFASTMSLLGGCPLYDDNGSSGYCSDCPSGTTTTNTSTNTGQPCSAPEQCVGINETCASDGYCKTGDCFLHGCVTGYECSKDENLKLQCVPAGTGSGGFGGGTGGSSGGMGGHGTAGSGGGSAGSGGTGGGTAGAGGGSAGSGGTGGSGTGGSGTAGGSAGAGGGTAGSGGGTAGSGGAP